MPGPVVDTTQVGYGSFTRGGKGMNPGDTPGGLSFGVEGSYQSRRCLVDAKLLYQRRTYRIRPYDYDPGFSPYRVLQIDTDFSVLTIPFSVSYRLTRDANFQWFIGGSIAAEYLLKTGKRTIYTTDGVKPGLADSYIGIPIILGIQTTFRYPVLPNATLQLEPALRHYPTDGFPANATGTFQFQGTAAVLVTL